MPKRFIQRPAVLIDPIKHRIRIYKYVFRSLGNPVYIVLTTTCHDKSITITRSEEADPRAYSFKRTAHDNNRSPEIFSRSFIRSLYEINESWDKSQSYRIYGELSADGSNITFYLTDSALFLGEREWQS